MRFQTWFAALVVVGADRNSDNLDALNRLRDLLDQRLQNRDAQLTEAVLLQRLAEAEGERARKTEEESLLLRLAEARAAAAPSCTPEPPEPEPPTCTPPEPSCSAPDSPLPGVRSACSTESRVAVLPTAQCKTCRGGMLRQEVAVLEAAEIERNRIAEEAEIGRANRRLAEETLIVKLAEAERLRLAAEEAAEMERIRELKYRIANINAQTGKVENRRLSEDSLLMKLAGEEGCRNSVTDTEHEWRVRELERLTSTVKKETCGKEERLLSRFSDLLGQPSTCGQPSTSRFAALLAAAEEKK